jgi:branched-chain amino acid transport system substrate-binding protein
MTHQISRRHLNAGIGAILVSQAFDAPALAQSQTPFRIGLIMTYTGQFSDPAKQMDNGIRLYMKQHGDTVAGRKIEVLRRDTAGAPEAAKRLAQELIVRENVDVLAGFVITPEAMTVADLSAEAKKFMVVMNAATSIITTKSPYMTRSSMTLPQNCEVLGSWAFKNGIKKVFLLISDYAPGHDAEAAFRRAFTEAGGEIAGSVRIPLANPDFSAFVQRAKDSNPDGMFVFVPSGSQPVALSKSLIERGVDPNKIKILGQGELSDEAALKALGESATGFITAFHYDYAHNSPANQQFVKEYNAEFKRNPDYFSVGGYDGMHLIYEALKKSGGKSDGESLVGAVRGMEWESPRGRVSIDSETRDIINTVYVRKVEKVGSDVQNVEIAKFENIKDPVKARMK